MLVSSYLVSADDVGCEQENYSHIPNNSIGRNNSIGWKTTKI